jgi:hypothetical protein
MLDGKRIDHRDAGVEHPRDDFRPGAEALEGGPDLRGETWLASDTRQRLRRADGLVRLPCPSPWHAGERGGDRRIRHGGGVTDKLLAARTCFNLLQRH